MPRRCPARSIRSRLSASGSPLRYRASVLRLETESPRTAVCSAAVSCHWSSNAATILARRARLSRSAEALDGTVELDDLRRAWGMLTPCVYWYDKCTKKNATCPLAPHCLPPPSRPRSLPPRWIPSRAQRVLYDPAVLHHHDQVARGVPCALPCQLGSCAGSACASSMSRAEGSHRGKVMAQFPHNPIRPARGCEMIASSAESVGTFSPTERVWDLS